MKNKKNNNKKLEVKEEEKDEEYIKNEKLINEKLNKFVVNVDKGLISSMRKRNDDCYILKEIDFYSIKVYVQTFGNIIRIIEKAKTMYKNLNEEIAILKMPKKEQYNIRIQKKKERDILNKRKDKYNDLINYLNNEKINGRINEKDYEIKVSQIQEMYKDIFDKLEKSGTDYATDITLQEFLDTLKNIEIQLY